MLTLVAQTTTKDRSKVPGITLLVRRYEGIDRIIDDNPAMVSTVAKGLRVTDAGLS